ncbi:MAG: hypothetical protein JEY94_08065 [Melioribacteraceae bacterium]|nr:hypothetical protein [Melioribacteraceae bacterium]
MLKVYSIVVTIICVAFGANSYYAWKNSEEKIAKAENDLIEYQDKYSLIIEKSDSLESIVQKLQLKGNNYQNRIDSLEVEIVNLKTENEKMIDEVADLFQPGELVDEVRNTFPELKTSPIGIARVKHPETGFMIRTFQLPLQFVATFIADHKELENAKKQITALGDINFTYKSYVALKDSIITLKEEKAAEYKNGLDYGMQKYESLVKEYISTLKNPPKIEFPSWTTTIISGAAGVAAGILITK